MVISQIFTLLGVLFCIGIYAQTFHGPFMTMLDASPLYGPGGELNLIFVGIGFLVFGVAIFSLFNSMKQQPGF